MTNLRIRYVDNNWKSTITKATCGDNNMNNFLQHHSFPGVSCWCVWRCGSVMHREHRKVVEWRQKQGVNHRLQGYQFRISGAAEMFYIFFARHDAIRVLSWSCTGDSFLPIFCHFLLPLCWHVYTDSRPNLRIRLPISAVDTNNIIQNI